MKSSNVLYIESISTFPIQEGMFTMLVSELDYKLKFYCPITGNYFKQIDFKAQGKGIDNIECLRNAIQNMLDGKVDIKHSIFNREFKCDIHYGINHLEVSHLEKEWQDLFRQLFDLNKWDLKKMSLTE